MKILVISQPVWKNENNSGNTLFNVFRDFNAEFCNIYCSEGFPNNSICKKYYQITDYMVLENIKRGTATGRSFAIDDIQGREDTGFEKKARKHKNSFTLLLRELAWKVARVENDSLYNFIKENSPDLIYAPTYGNFRMLRLVRNIKKKTGLPLVSYISDDLYNYESGMNVIDRVNRYFLRKSLQENFKLYDLVYTMTDEQKEEYEKIFGREMKILRKSSLIEYKRHVKNDILNIVYAGGTYEGRESTLVEIANAIRDLNKDRQRYMLNIYTNSEIENLNVLDDKTNSEVHKAKPYDELLAVYQDSDVGLHAESFKQKDREHCRLSFSTKIVDCLQSGGAVLSVCPDDNAGFRYLKREDAALCIDDISGIKDGLSELYNHYELYQKKAYECLCRNHDKKINTKNLEEDFKRLI